jgi:serine/threonine protein kinase
MATECSAVDDFRIMERLGRGSFADAFLGYNVSSGERFVIKVYRFGKMNGKRMLREIYISQKLCGHPNIARLLYVVKQSITGYPALVFEYFPSAGLQEQIEQLEPHEVRFFASQLLSGIAHAHQLGVIHKDIKPSNIIIDRAHGKLKIIDWGLSSLVGLAIAPP